jgi:DNA-binding Xre family transcriptional regulator
VEAKTRVITTTKEDRLAEMAKHSENKLDDLAQRINEEHRKVEVAMGNALKHARRAGKLLVEAKEGMPHGEWLGWLEANFEGSERVAQMYMRVHSHWAEIEANTKSVSDLTLTGALRAIGPPEEDATTRERAQAPIRWEGVEVDEEPAEPREPETTELIQASPEGLEASAQANRELSEDLSEWSSAERELLDTFRGDEDIVVNMHEHGPHENLLKWLKDEQLFTRADRKSVSQSTIANIERNNAEPQFRTIRKLAKALEVDPTELLGE